jgi:spermidine synthase
MSSVAPDADALRDGTRPAARDWLDSRGPILALIVFVGGLSSIAIETSASRLIGPYFGSSTLIWANLIGLTLLYLTIGYFLGGRIADRWPQPAVLYMLTAGAGVSAAIVPFAARPILEISLSAFENTNVGAFLGSLFGTILLFAFPITLLGMVSPFAVRLRLANVSCAGNTAGSLYSLSTIGSILGSFLPAFLFIPVFGTQATFLLLAFALLIPSALALAIMRAQRQFAVASAFILTAVLLPIVDQQGLVRPPEYGEVIYEAETRYNYVQVLDRDGEILLALNEGHAIHSIYDPRSAVTGGPWDYFMMGPYFHPDTQPDDIHSLMLIGLAAGTVTKQFTEAYGPVEIDGVEIDGEIVDIGREYFDMNEPNLNVIVADGRYALNKSDKTYDVIGIDAYRQPYIPFHLTTKEFFEEVANHLTPGGVAVVNAGRTRTDFRLVEVIAATMNAVYDDVYLIDVARFNNTMVIGVNGSSSVEDFTVNVDALPEGSILRQVGDAAVEFGSIRRWDSDAMVFTDDKAPVEQVVDQIILGEAQRR